jgi:hypothetical protein
LGTQHSPNRGDQNVQEPFSSAARVLSLGLIMMAVAQPFSSAAPAQLMDLTAYFDRTDYYFRHSEFSSK